MKIVRNATVDTLATERRGVTWCGPCNAEHSEPIGDLCGYESQRHARAQLLHRQTTTFQQALEDWKANPTDSNEHRKDTEYAKLQTI